LGRVGECREGKGGFKNGSSDGKGGVGGKSLMRSKEQGSQKTRLGEKGPDGKTPGEDKDQTMMWQKKKRGQRL